MSIQRPTTSRRTEHRVKLRCPRSPRSGDGSPHHSRRGPIAVSCVLREATLNGIAQTVSYEPGSHVLEMLREDCGVTSPKDGCAPQGYCGCCAILVDDRPALACMRDPETLSGKAVTTLEGIPERQREVLALAFVKDGAVQCGYCTPGIVIRASSLLERGQATDPETVAKALSGHLCRCTGFTRIVDAICSAGEAWEDGTLPEGPPRRADFFGAGSGMVSSGDAASNGVGGCADRYRGQEHALGTKPYIADMKVEGMLHGAVVLSAHARARVDSLDATAAESMPGVARVVTATDVPGDRFVGLIHADWPIFVAVGETTRCVGDVLALVVADTQLRARQAADAVAIGYDVLEPVTDPVAALAADAPSVHSGSNLLDVCAFARGDVDSALSASAHVIDHEYSTQRIEHAFLEPEACLAVPQGDQLHVYSQGQGVHDDSRPAYSIAPCAQY